MAAPESIGMPAGNSRCGVTAKKSIAYQTNEGMVMDEYVQRVRLRAYLIWERKGRPEGAAEDHWHEAEKELSQEGDAAGLQAGRHYDKGVKEFERSGRVERAAKEARDAIEGPERADLEKAQETARRVGRGEDVSSRRYREWRAGLASIGVRGRYPHLSKSRTTEISRPLEGKKIAILSTDGVEQSELTEPRQALEKAGAETILVSPAGDTIQVMTHREKGDTFEVDKLRNNADPNDFDGLLSPGGVANPDELRTNVDAVSFVRTIFDSGKPIAAICHGPWMLVEADVVRGRTLTSWPSLKTDINNAGGTWTNCEVVQEGQMTTSRKPDDIPAFIQAVLAAFAATPADMALKAINAHLSR